MIKLSDKMYSYNANLSLYIALKNDDILMKLNKVIGEWIKEARELEDYKEKVKDVFNTETFILHDIINPMTKKGADLKKVLRKEYRDSQYDGTFTEYLINKFRDKIYEELCLEVK